MNNKTLGTIHYFNELGFLSRHERRVGIQQMPQWNISIKAFVSYFYDEKFGVVCMY